MKTHLKYILISLAFVATTIYASTTIGTNISTDGSLTVTSTSTTTNLNVTGNSIFGGYLNIGLNEPDLNGGDGAGNSVSTILNSPVINNSLSARAYPNVTEANYFAGGTADALQNISNVAAYFHDFFPRLSGSFGTKYVTENVSMQTDGGLGWAMATNGTNGFNSIATYSRVGYPTFIVNPGSSATLGLDIQAYSGQTANLFRTLASDGTTVTSSIKPDGGAYFGGRVGIGTTTPAAQLVITSGASATTTVTIGELGLTSSKGCVNMNQANGTPGSFYLAGGVMKVENNYCR